MNTLSTGKAFSENDIKLIKSYLARGLSVSVGILAEINKEEFMPYNGETVLSKPCETHNTDH